MVHYVTFNLDKTQNANCHVSTWDEKDATSFPSDATFVPTKFNLFGCAALVAVVPAIQNLVGQDGDISVLVNLTT
jgi:hypothetical protein